MGKHLNKRFLVSGTPSELAAWTALAAQMGLTRVELLRMLANQAVAKNLKKKRAVTLPADIR